MYVHASLLEEFRDCSTRSVKIVAGMFRENQIMCVKQRLKIQDSKQDDSFVNRH